MKVVLGIIFALWVCAFCSSGFAADKIDKQKIVGKWELVKSDSPEAPKGAIVDFSKDGKLTVVLDFNGKQFNVNGTYKVEGEKLVVTMEVGTEKKTETDTIDTLTDEKLITVDKDKKKTEFKKKK